MGAMASPNILTITRFVCHIKDKNKRLLQYMNYLFKNYKTIMPSREMNIFIHYHLMLVCQSCKRPDFNAVLNKNTLLYIGME
jgi:hypothetical protein